MRGTGERGPENGGMLGSPAEARGRRRKTVAPRYRQRANLAEEIRWGGGAGGGGGTLVGGGASGFARGRAT